MQPGNGEVERLQRVTKTCYHLFSYKRDPTDVLSRGQEPAEIEKRHGPYQGISYPAQINVEGDHTATGGCKKLDKTRCRIEPLGVMMSRARKG
jgi:hypothetical protein